MFSSTRQTGQWAEQLAYQHLCQQGLKLIQRNFSCRYGELDLIMRHGQYVVFVEVRYRASQQYGGAIASIDARKQAKVTRVAQYFLQTQPQLRNSWCRFDAVLVTGQMDAPQLQWIQNAFGG